MKATGRYNAYQLLPLAIAALRRYAGRAPRNIMGGCSDCGSEMRRVHKPRCKWMQARRAIAEFNALKRAKLI